MARAPTCDRRPTRRGAPRKKTAQRTVRKRKPYPFWVDACDVVRGLMSYGRYGRDPRKAARALQRRHPEVGEESCLRTVEAYGRVHEDAFEALPRHLRDRPKQGVVYASMDDVDVEACAAELQAAHPSVERSAIDFLVGWAVFWGYLK